MNTVTPKDIADDAVVLDVRDYVLTRSGRTPRITDPATLTASTGVDPGISLTDETHIAFHVSADYSGRSSVSFTVRDGAADIPWLESATLEEVRAETADAPVVDLPDAVADIEASQVLAVDVPSGVDADTGEAGHGIAGFVAVHLALVLLVPRTLPTMIIGREIHLGRNRVVKP